MRVVLLTIALCASGFAAASASDEPDRITVTATGTASVKPDVAEVRASISGSAALATDALRKFQDNRRRAVDTIKKLKLENLTIEGSGVSMSTANQNANRMAMVFGNNQNAGTPGHVTVTEKLVLRLSSIDRLKEGEPAKLVSTVIDAAKDAGLTLGGSGMQSDLVRFRSTKLDEARHSAVENAMQSARRKAEKLASLSKAVLFRILTSREVSLPVAAASSPGGQNAFVSMMLSEMGMSGGGDSDDTSSAEFKPIPVSVTVEVQFAAAGGQ
jgi:uncharacterized protein YggE